MVGIDFDKRMTQLIIMCGEVMDFCTDPVLQDFLKDYLIDRNY